MDYKVNDNKIIINNKTIEFNFKVREIIEFHDKMIILLDIPTNKQFLEDIENENIYAFNSSGEFIWRIGKVKETFPSLASLVYYGIHKNEENEIIVNDFGGRRFVIDPESGKIVKKLAEAR